MDNTSVVEVPRRVLTEAQFHHLADVPTATTWFADIDNPQTRRACQNDLQEFMRFTGIAAPDQFRIITRAHMLAWRQDLERRALSGATIRRKLGALSSLFEHLRECNAVLHNPVDGVKRPRVESQEGKTPAAKAALQRAAAIQAMMNDSPISQACLHFKVASAGPFPILKQSACRPFSSGVAAHT